MLCKAHLPRQQTWLARNLLPMDERALFYHHDIRGEMKKWRIQLEQIETLIIDSEDLSSEL